MSTDISAVTALRRFGLGARPGDLAAIRSDPRGFVLANLKDRQAALLDDLDLDSSATLMANVQLAREQRKQQREAAQDAMREGHMVPFPGDRASGTPGAPAGARPANIRREAYQLEAAVRFERLSTTSTPFVERLVMFWSNIFCVSVSKGPVRAIAGAFEREAIRPHVLGRFSDMLVAVEQHPAMLIYLDNQLSIGPNSLAGLRREKGLNENLSREILELHTLGADGGYQQSDVTNLARLITGWSVAGLDNRKEQPGSFIYLPQRREPGSWAVAGKTYQNTGLETGIAVLRDLARHPSTARNIARRVARHFVSETPPPALVEALAANFRKTDGDLAELARTLVSAEEAWMPARPKVVPPNDYLVALVRSFPMAQRPRPQEIVRLSNQLGQPLWNVPSPKGWPEEDLAWASPSAMRERLRIAEVAARLTERGVDPRKLVEDLFGGGASENTRQAIARAETREQGLVLLAMSPEFQKR
jgi:uncharacterized protein (DUF1800 family)